MQTIEPKLRGDVASMPGREPTPRPTDAPTELPPTLQEALQQMLDHPATYTIGDLAALTDRLTSELMLFSALVGVGATVTRAVSNDHGPAACDPQSTAQAELHAAFVAELEG
jgi:hypothetical protein